MCEFSRMSAGHFKLIHLLELSKKISMFGKEIDNFFSCQYYSKKFLPFIFSQVFSFFLVQVKREDFMIMIVGN